MTYGLQYKELGIGPVVLGGQADSRPAFAVGSIFYDGHSIVTDPHEGVFDEQRAARLLAWVNDAAARCGSAAGVDVIAASEPAMERFVEFVAARTPLPIIINGSEADVRIAGLRKCQELGALGRTIYASLTEDTEPQEIDVLQAIRPAGVMILAANVGDATPAGCVAMVRERFLPLLDTLGVEVPIVDVGVMDAPSLGLSLRAIRAIKDEYGYPVGGAFGNAVFTWPGLCARGPEALNATLAASAAICRAYGADFLHYGILEKASVAIQAVATCEVFLGYAAQMLDGVELSQPHPIRCLFR